MTNYLSSVFKVLYQTSPDTRESIDVGPEELAAITAQQCFEDADLNHDGRLSYDEFQRWYSLPSGGGVAAPLTSPRSAASPACKKGACSERLTTCDRMLLLSCARLACAL